MGDLQKGRPNALYAWKESIPEEDEATLCDLDEEFEEYDKESPPSFFIGLRHLTIGEQTLQESVH